MILSSKDEQNISDIYDSFDENDSNSVDISLLGTMVSLLGYNPTKKGISDVIKEANLKDTISKNDFMQIMKSWSSHLTSDEEILNAFRLFDKNGDGNIDGSVLKYVLQETGEAFTNQEFESFIKESETENKFNYIDYINNMVTKVTK